LRSLNCLGSKQDSVSGYGLLFTPDSRTLVAGGHGVFAWDVTTGKEQTPVTPGHFWVSGLAWAADGKNLITRGAALAVFDFTNRKKLTAWDGHEGEVRSLALSPDGQVLASGAGDSAVRLWDIAAGREIGQLAGGLGGTRHLAWSADGQRLIASGTDGVLRVWDVARQRLERQFSVELELLDEMAVAPTGDTAAVIAWDFLNGRARITLWDVPAGKKRRQMEMVTSDFGPSGAAFSPDGRVLASSLADGAIHLWDVGTGKKLGECNGGGKDVLFTVIFSPDGRSLVSVPIEMLGQEERIIRLWDIATGKEVRQFRGSARWVPGAAFSPDGRTLFTGGVDGTLRLWEVATGKQRAILKGDQPMISCVAFAPGGAFLISGSHDSTILVWDARHVFQSSAATDATMASDTWKALWQELASDDAAVAYQAVGRLSRASQTVAQARLLLQPAKSADAELVKTLVQQLESEDFLVRQRASQELETLGDGGGLLPDLPWKHASVSTDFWANFPSGRCRVRS